MLISLPFLCPAGARFATVCLLYHPIARLHHKFVNFPPRYERLLRISGQPEGQDLEGAALEHLPKGRVPLKSRLFWGGRAQAPVPLPRWYSLRGRSPAYPFFRKEKIYPHRRGRDFLCRVKRCATHGIPLPSASLLAPPPFNNESSTHQPWENPEKFDI